jgi:mannitol-1-phosphate/altronate dehydrogenase
MNYIIIKNEAGEFAENKDIAARLREEVLLPSLRQSQEITVDFTGVSGATQSFVHALVSEALREFSADVLDHIIFKGCNENIQQIVLMVTDYMQESI